jgi:hypothetical protein
MYTEWQHVGQTSKGSATIIPLFCRQSPSVPYEPSLLNSRHSQHHKQLEFCRGKAIIE